MESWTVWRYERFVDDVTGLIIGGEYNARTTHSDVPALVMAHMKPIAINYGMIVSPLATNAVKTTHIHSWCHGAGRYGDTWE